MNSEQRTGNREQLAVVVVWGGMRVAVMRGCCANKEKRDAGGLRFAGCASFSVPPCESFYKNSFPTNSGDTEIGAKDDIAAHSSCIKEIEKIKYGLQRVF